MKINEKDWKGNLGWVPDLTFKPKEGPKIKVYNMGGGEFDSKSFYLIPYGNSIP